MLERFRSVAHALVRAFPVLPPAPGAPTIAAAPSAIACATLGVYAAAIALAPNLATAVALAAPLVLIPLAWWTLLAPSRWIAVFFFAALLLPPLPIRLGDSGPHVAILAAAFGLLAGLLRVSEWRLRPDLVSAALFLYLAVLAGSVAMAAYWAGAQVAAASLARVMLFGIAIYVFFYTAYGPAGGAEDRFCSSVKALFWIAAASAALACIDFYYQLPAPAGFGPQFVWLDTGVFRRAQGVFYEASTLGNFCAFFLTMIAAALLRPKAGRPLPLPALAAGGVLFSAALLFSYSRASLVNLAVAVGVLLFLNRERIRLRRLAVIGAIVVAAAAIAGRALPAFADLYWGRLAGTARFLFSATESVLSGRVDSWRILTRFLLDHPLAALLGVGYKVLPYSSVTGHPLIVDNTYLSLLAETGVLGLAALALFNFAILRAAWRAVRAADPRRSFYGAWIFSFWIGQLFQMLSGDLLTYWRVLPVYFWVLALAVRE
jgi:O-antigen ligase